MLLDSQILLLYSWYLWWTLACLSIKWHYFSYEVLHVKFVEAIALHSASTIFSFIFQRNENSACARNKIAHDGYGECIYGKLNKPPWGFTVAKHICVYVMLKQKYQRDADSIRYLIYVYGLASSSLSTIYWYEYFVGSKIVQLHPNIYLRTY